MRPTTPRLVLVALAALALASPAAAERLMLDPADPLNQEVRALHDDISLANLINGLSLTGEQLDALAVLATEADRLRGRYQHEAVPVLAEMDRSFAALRAEVTETGEPTAEVRHAAGQAENAFLELRAEFQRELAGLEGQVRVVLDDGQVRIAEEFEPCLFPPESLGSPLRVGQSGASTHLMQMLDELRTVPDNTYARRKVRVVDGALEKIDVHRGPLTPGAEAEARAALEGLVEEVRGVDDLDWQVEGPLLAERFHDVVAPRPPAPHPHDPARAQLTRVGKYFLAPGAVEVLSTIAARPEPLPRATADRTE